MLTKMVPEVANHFVQITQFANQHGILDKFLARVHYLCTYGSQQEQGAQYRTTLFQDFAPHSMLFKVERMLLGCGWASLLSGGLIYHGPTEETDPSWPPSANTASWEVHT